MLHGLVETIFLVQLAKLSTAWEAEHANCERYISDNVKVHSEGRFSAPSVPTMIDTKLVISSLNSMDDASGTMSITAGIHFRWWDQRFAVNDMYPSCAHEKLILSATYIWYPHFIVRNGAK